METKDLTPRNWFKKRHFPIRKEEGSLWKTTGRDIEKMFEDFAQDFSNFDTFLSRFFKENMNANLKALPRMDLSETNKEYIVELDLPGVTEENLDMSISQDNILTIYGKRESEKEQKERNYYKLERSYGSFERTLALPENCDTDKVVASFENGTVTIKLPKKEPKSSAIKKIKLNK